jgi:carbonic anhydrase
MVYENKDGPTAPIDLTKNTTGVCNLKCSYSFKYPPTNLQITNKGSYISFKVDNSSSSPVIYNDQNYNVQEARLYQPSLHTYAGQHADAELIISHTNTISTKKLLVSIPIKTSSTSTSDSSTFFDLIFIEVQKTANSQGQQAMYNNPTFTLGKFVPMTPYYSYTGTLPWAPQNGTYAYVVYSIENAIAMSTQSMSVLKSVVYQSNTTIQTNPYDIFYNSVGPVTPSQGEIYIDCQPTGDDGEILVPAKIDTGGLLDNQLLQSLINSNLVKILIGALIMIGIWKLSMKVILGIASHASKTAGGGGIKGGTGHLNPV